MLNNVSPRARTSAISSADNPEPLVDGGGAAALVSAPVAGVAKPGAADGVAASGWMGSTAGAATACSAAGVAGSGAGIGTESVRGAFSMLRVVAFAIA